MNLENTSVQMRKGILEFCVMHVIARGEVYTSDLIQELTAARMVVVEGTLYPLLTRLKNAGLLQYAWKESTSGPPRKYYSLTDQGTNSLAALTETWNEISASVSSLLSPPVANTFYWEPAPEAEPVVGHVETPEILADEQPTVEAEQVAEVDATPETETATETLAATDTENLPSTTEPTAETPPATDLA
jgi:PadR family transcriptional regulator PadR